MQTQISHWVCGRPVCRRSYLLNPDWPNPCGLKLWILVGMEKNPPAAPLTYSRAQLLEVG